MPKNQCFLFILVLFISTKVSFGQCDWTDFQSHEVQPGETVFGISKNYGLSVDQLILCNDSLAGDYVIKPGQVLRIPVVPQESIEDVLDTEHYVYHQVEQGQTIYSISKLYPDLNVDQIKEWNSLPSNEISIGQYLIVGEIEKKALFGPIKKKKQKKLEAQALMDTFPRDSSSHSLTLKEDSLAVEEDSTIALKLVDTSAELSLIKRVDQSIAYENSYQEAMGGGKTEQFAKGIANYLEGSDDEPLVVLCDDVAIGQIVKIRNLINNQITYAKVIGKLPSTEKDNIMVKLSYSTARKLNVLDKKVLVELAYLN